MTEPTHMDRTRVDADWVKHNMQNATTYIQLHVQVILCECTYSPGPTSSPTPGKSLLLVEQQHCKCWCLIAREYGKFTKFPMDCAKCLKYECLTSYRMVHWRTRGPYLVVERQWYQHSTSLLIVFVHLLYHQTWHVYHKVHLWNNTVSCVELTKNMVVVINQTGEICCLIFYDLWREQMVHYLHHHKKILPVFIILRYVVSDGQWKNSTKHPHLCGYTKKPDMSIDQDYSRVLMIFCLQQTYPLLCSSLLHTQKSYEKLSTSYITDKKAIGLMYITFCNSMHLCKEGKHQAIIFYVFTNAVMHHTFLPQ